MGERLRWLRTKASRLLRRGKHEAEVDRELQFHYEQLVDQYRAEGLSPRDAEDAARRELGDVGSYREEVRDAWRPPELAEVWRTVRFAARSLWRSPGFTTLAILMLALGIGANTVMFSALNSIVLKPLPYDDSARLDRIDRASAQDPEGRMSPADLRDLQPELRAYGEVAAYAAGDVSLADPGRPAEVTRALRVTGNFFATLRVVPELGRDFLPEESRPGGDRVVLLSRRAWQNRFGGRADIVGHAVRIDGVPHVIVGVLPRSFNEWRHLGYIDVFRPLALTPEQSADRQTQMLRLLGRRADDVSADRAAAFFAAFGARLAKDHPAVNAGSRWRAYSLEDGIQGKNGRTIMEMLIGLSGFVLLIACSNLANLFLARTIARARELALRSALGASRGQLVRPLIAESLVLAAAGGACALLVAAWASDWLAVRSTGDNGEQVILAFDWKVFGWALGASLLTAVAFGAAPALFAARLDLNETLKNGARGATGGRGHQRFRHLLIVGQFALAMVLLAGAGLFIRGLDELTHRRSGWDSARLISGALVLPDARYPDDAKRTAFYRDAVERLQSLPGVAAASASSFTPFFDWPDARRYVVEGREPPEPGHEPAALVNVVSPRYFDTVGTPLLSGRAFDDRDAAGAPAVVIISQTMASDLFGNQSPIGRRLLPMGGADRRPAAIVGVAADVRSVSPDAATVTFQLYRPLAQEPGAHAEIVVRAAGVPPLALVDTVRTEMAKLDPDLPVRKLQPSDVTIDRANYSLGVLRDMLIAFAVLGLLLASLGIYGVIARTMAQRTAEFAIRFALGARVSNVVRIVLTAGLKLALVGSLLGLAGAFGVARLLANGFPAMRLDSPMVLGATTLLLVTVALVACWLPARRAARIHPIEALRAE